MKQATFNGTYLISVIAFLLLVINAYASHGTDKNAVNAMEPGANYLLPIGFQVAAASKTDTNNYAEKDSSSKIVKNKFPSKKRIYKVDLNPDFSHTALRKTEEAFRQAELYDADYILIHMNADNPEAESATSFIQSKLGYNSKPVFFYVDSKTSPNRSLLTITKVDSTNSRYDSKRYNIQHYHFNNNPKTHGKEKTVKRAGLSAIINRNNQSLNPAEYNAVAGNLIIDILQNNNLSNFDVVQYNPGKYGKLIDTLTQKWVCLLFVALLTWFIAIQLKTREAGPHSFFILSLLAIMLGALYEERLANFNDICLFLTGIILLLFAVFTRQKLTEQILTCTGGTLSTCGLALMLTSYNTDLSLFLPQLSINMLLICTTIAATLKLHAFTGKIRLQNLAVFKKMSWNSLLTNQQQ